MQYTHIILTVRIQLLNLHHYCIINTGCKPNRDLVCYHRHCRFLNMCDLETVYYNDIGTYMYFLAG